jgi:small-conductance mechanosensitive channel
VFKQPLSGFRETSRVVALIIGLALRNIILDLFTGLAVNIERPCKTGDHILVHQRNPDVDIVGQVVEINWRATRIRTEENTLVVIPNSLISMFVISNFHNSGFPTRFEIYFTIDYSIPSARVKRILMAGVKEVINQQGFVSNREPSVLVDETNELGVRYKVRYWIAPWKNLSPSRSRDIVISNILEHLTSAGITPAYPKEDIYYEQMPVRHLDSRALQDRKELLRKVALIGSLRDFERENPA